MQIYNSNTGNYTPPKGLYEHFLYSPNYYLVKRDLSGKYLYVNPAYAKRFDFLGQNLIGEDLNITVYGKIDLDKIQTTIHQIIQNPNEIVSIKVRKRKPNDDWWWVKWDFSAIKNESGNVVEIMSIGYDVTESHTYELRAFEYNKKVNTILESITDGFYIINQAWNFVRVNKIFAQTLNKSIDDLIGKNFWQFFPNNESSHYTKSYKKAMYEKETVRFEEFWSGKYFQVTAYPSPDGVTVFFQDITDQKRKTQEILLQNALLKEIAHIQSHELRRPVATILGLIHLIKGDSASVLSTEMEEYLLYLEKATQELDVVIHKVVEKTYIIND